MIKCIKTIALLSFFSFNLIAIAQNERPTKKALSLNIGVNQFDRGSFFVEGDLFSRSRNGLYRYFNHKLSLGYAPWDKAVAIEGKSYVTIMGFISVGGSLGYHFFRDKSLSTLTVKPQIGINIMIASLYYGYNYSLNPNSTLGVHNLTFSIFLFAYNTVTKKSLKDFIWWGNLFFGD